VELPWNFYVVNDIVVLGRAFLAREGLRVGVTKRERLAEIFRRLAAAPPAASHDEAYRLLCDTIDAVEDEMTTTPNDPANWMTDARIYPPLMDRRFDIQGHPDLKRYASAAHNTFIRDNGAITTVIRHGPVVFEKVGADGRGTDFGATP
jgi:hypothetical protein